MTLPAYGIAAAREPIFYSFYREVLRDNESLWRLRQTCYNGSTLAMIRRGVGRQLPSTLATLAALG
jgi:hypothetical protein